MRRIRNRRSVLLALVTCLFLFDFKFGSAYGNFLGLDDHDRLRPVTLRMRSISNDLSEFMIHPPMPRATPLESVKSAVRTQECAIRLAGSFSTIEADFDSLNVLIGLAAKMNDARDELLLLQFVKLYAGQFIQLLKPYRGMLKNTTERTCSDDGAAVAKGQEISRVYDEAETLVQSVLNKVSAVLPH